MGTLNLIVGCTTSILPAVELIVFEVDAVAAVVDVAVVPAISASFLSYCTIDVSEIRNSQIDGVAHETPLATTSGCTASTGLNVCPTITLAARLKPGVYTFDLVAVLNKGETDESSRAMKQYTYTVKCSNTVIITPTIASSFVFTKRQGSESNLSLMTEAEAR